MPQTSKACHAVKEDLVVVSLILALKRIRLYDIFHKDISSHSFRGIFHLSLLKKCLCLDCRAEKLDGMHLFDLWRSLSNWHISVQSLELSGELLPMEKGFANCPP